MGSELERRESVPDGVRRIALSHANDALGALRNPRSMGTLRDAIHEARKSLKHTRSALRLLRPAVPKKRWAKLDRRLRKAAALLSDPRDDAAAVETLDLLVDHYGGVLRPEPFGELRAHLVERHTRTLWRAVERERVLARATHRIERAGTRLASADLAWTDGEPLWFGPIRRSYKRARRKMLSALDIGTPEDFHSWRKAAKHLRHQLAIFAQAWGGHLDQADLLLHELTDLLGEHHDLESLAARLSDTSAPRSTAIRMSERRALLGLIEGRRREIEEDAEAVGRRLFTRRPRDVIGRLRTLWEAWQSEI